jgi:hypothetical protein
MPGNTASEARMEADRQMEYSAYRSAHLLLRSLVQRGDATRGYAHPGRSSSGRNQTGNHHSPWYGSTNNRDRGRAGDRLTTMGAGLPPPHEPTKGAAAHAPFVQLDIATGHLSQRYRPAPHTKATIAALRSTVVLVPSRDHPHHNQALAPLSLISHA